MRRASILDLKEPEVSTSTWRDGFAAWTGLHRAILRGVRAGQILEGIASAAARHAQAEFVAIGCFVGKEIVWQALAGRPECAALLHSTLARDLVQSVLAKGGPVLRTLNTSEAEVQAETVAEAVRIYSLIALPLPGERALRGMLLAGFASGQRAGEKKLERYAALAEAAFAGEGKSERLAGFESAFTALFESSTEVLLVTDSRGLIQQANRQARELLGLKEKRPKAVSLVDFFSAAARDAIAVWLQRAASELTSHPAEAALETGSVVKLHRRSAFGTGKGLVLCVEERPHAQRPEQKWKQVEAELRSVLDAVEVGILLLDLSGRIRFTNARFAVLFGLEKRRLRRLQDFDELTALVQDNFPDPQVFAQRWRNLPRAADQGVQDELEMVRPVRKVFERYARPVLDAEGRRVGWLEIYRDITAEGQIQAKLLQTEKMAALGQLVSGIAHELNNPLTAIMGYGQLLLGHGLRPAQLGEAKKIYQEAERARRIVKNLLFFAREAKPERVRVDLNEVVERTLALRSYELKVENIVVECELDPDLPATLADPYQLQQVVLNLLVNAEQALLQGRGQGSIWIRTMRLPGSRLALEVADDGPGVPPEIASRVFDPFFTTKPPGVGTGLGLSIVYGIVQQHGGEVSLESPPGAGAKFVVELPVVESPAEGVPASEPQFETASANVAAGRILVVEDEPTVGQLIADVLREEGHRVDVVTDSQEGLNQIARTNYDLVICDLRMPRLDGPAFYETLVRARSPAQHRIIFITGDTLAPRTLEFLKPHGLPYLAKPFLVEELKLAVNRALERSRADSGHAPPNPDAAGQPEEMRRR